MKFNNPKLTSAMKFLVKNTLEEHGQQGEVPSPALSSRAVHAVSACHAYSESDKYCYHRDKFMLLASGIC